MKKQILGKWRITEMECWDLDYIDLVEEGYIEFSKDGLGSFVFGTISADCGLTISF